MRRADILSLTVGLAIAVVEVSPSPEALGSTVSLFLVNSTLMRAFAPALGTSILAYGIERQVADGQLVWIVLWVCAAVLSAYTRTLPDLKETKDESSRETLIRAEEGQEA